MKRYPITEADENVITLRVVGDIWVAKFHGPRRLDIMGLFDTDELPTRFRDTAPSADVLAEITALNPECRVTFAQCHICDSPTRCRKAECVAKSSIDND